MTRVMIYGSRVSRDAYKRLDESYSLIEYVARQSVISSASPATKLLNTGALSSAFQIRSVRNDHRSSLFPEIGNAAGQIDLLLMDLIDERLGVVNLPDDTWVTYSAELVRSGTLDSLPGKPAVLKLGTDRHFYTWRRAMGRLISRLETYGLKEKTLVLRTPWATHTEDGEETPAFRGKTAAEMNEIYERYYDHLEETGLHVARLPAEYAVCPANHEWGTAAYHYNEQAYTWMGRQVENALPRVAR